MATFRVNFIKAALEKIVPPSVAVAKKGVGGVYDTYYDTKEKGLVLLVSNGGGKTYYLYTKIGGRPERVKLGPYTDLSIEAARKKAAAHRGSIVEGKNPQQIKRAFRQEATLKELFQEYMERYSKKQKKSWKYDEREIPKFLSHWFNRKISTITTQEIQKLHERIRDESGLYQANRLLERLRAMYNKAIEWKWEGVNPAIGIKKFGEKSRDRFLQPHELPYFFAALEAEQNSAAKDYILLSLFTGARKANVLSMRWDEISFEQARWRIPETKNGEPVNIPLSSQALTIIENRRNTMRSGWVFPSEASAKGHLQDPKKAWLRLTKRAEIYHIIDLLTANTQDDEKTIAQIRHEIEENLSQSLAIYRAKAAKQKIDVSRLGLSDIRIHDLRRSMGSWQAVTGATGFIIGKSLGHKSQQATAIYARLNLDPVRESVQKATDAIITASMIKNMNSKS